MVHPFILKLRHGVNLSDEDEDHLTDLLASNAEISADHILVDKGCLPDAVYVLAKGMAGRFKMLPDGRRSITGLLLPGDLSSTSMTSDRTMDHAIVTLSRCEVVRLPQHALGTMARISSGIAEALRWAELVELNMLREWLVNMSLRNADARMAHFFCEILVRLQAVGLATEDSFMFPLAQTDLAKALGMSVVHINRTLRELRDARLIMLAKRLVTIPDPHRLKTFAQFSPDYLRLHKPPGTTGTRP